MADEIYEFIGARNFYDHLMIIIIFQRDLYTFFFSRERERLKKFQNG